MNTLAPIAVAIVMLLLAGKAAAKAESDEFSDNACVQCHQDLPGRSSEIVHREWRQSVHFTAKVGCEGCHGGNASVRREQFASDEELKQAAHLARSPEFLTMHREASFITAARGRSVSYFCGKCHEKIKEHHLGSPHGEFGQPSCLYCHGGGSHRIEPATLDIIDLRSRAEGGRCTACHRAATMESVRRIKKHLTETETRIRQSGEQYAALEHSGYRNLELARLHDNAGEARSRIRQIFHSFNMRDIAELTSQIETTADRTQAALELVQRLRKTQRHQTAVGAAAVLFLLSFAGLLVYYKNAFLVHSLWSPQPLTPQADAAQAQEVAVMERKPHAPEQPDMAFFPQLGICLMFAHFAITMCALLLGIFFARADGGGPGTQRVVQVLCWPLLTLGPGATGEHPLLFWPLMLGNSLLWGFAAASLVYPVRRWLRARP